MRKQYFFRPSKNGYFAWDVDRLIQLTSDYKTTKVLVNKITELDIPFRLEGSDDIPSYREVAEHAKLIDEADLCYPIIVSSTGRVMDGMHRVMKALNAGMITIEAVVFDYDPEPDYVDVMPDDLLY
ncbi:MAG TPA: hypothetical protein PKD26_13710 [Pyrinomonadaceae bacterium]|nr:hypothetical protein [Pyrinomonadaceae bacterium]